MLSLLPETTSQETVPPTTTLNAAKTSFRCPAVVAPSTLYGSAAVPLPLTWASCPPASSSV